jgi:protein SCO1/2
MNSRVLTCFCVALALTRAPTADANPPAEPLPGASLYHLNVALEPALGVPLALAQLRGHPVVVTMFYSSCAAACPVITFEMQRIEATLTPAERAQVRFVMVSFDDARDGPATLAAFVRERHLDPARWIVAHASAGNVRLLATALGIRYQRLPDGTYSHTSVITVLDRSGVPLHRSDDPSKADPALVQALIAATR